MEEESNVRESNFINDLKYIEGEVIARQANGKLCKYSNLAHCITVVNMDDEKYYSYWIDRYKPSKNTKSKSMIQDCKDKMDTIANLIDKKMENLMSLDEMIELEKNADERPEEKRKIIDAISQA